MSFTNILFKDGRAVDDIEPQRKPDRVGDLNLDSVVEPGPIGRDAYRLAARSDRAT